MSILNELIEKTNDRVLAFKPNSRESYSLKNSVCS